MNDDTYALLTRWHEAERRLYPLVLGDPDLYERSLVLVRGVADQLGDAPSVEALAARVRGATDLAVAAARRRGMSMRDLDPATIAQAGFSLRHTELRYPLRAYRMR